MGRHTIDCTSNTLGCSKDFTHSSGEFNSWGSWSHNTGDINYLVQCDISIMFDILDLLTIPGRLLEGSDNKGAGRGDNLDTGLSVLDDKFNGDLETFPVTSGLHDVISDLLWGQTQGTNFGSQGRCGCNLTSNNPQAYFFDLSGIELGRHYGY